jgi:mRNA interferase MazF
VVRGDVYAVNLSGKRGRAQRGGRYAVIVHDDRLLTMSTVLICPTSQSVRPASYRPRIEMGKDKTHVLCEMVGHVDAGRLGDRVGHLSREEITAVDEALELVLGLSGR